MPNPLEGKLRLRAALRKLKKMKGDGHSKLPVTADMLQHAKRPMDMTNDRDTWPCGPLSALDGSLISLLRAFLLNVIKRNQARCLRFAAPPPRETV